MLDGGRISFALDIAQETHDRVVKDLRLLDREKALRESLRQPS
jgi:hypothetical protein